MDERAINGAAIEAISDLELDCEIKGVLQSSGDEWCIQFSGKYGQYCDEFKNQFGEESSHQVIREKIKGHLIKQISKIRSGTGRKRKSAVVEPDDSREQGSGILTEPLKMVGEVFERLAGITGIVASQAATAAETARDAVADAASNLSPLTIEVRSKTRKIEKGASRRAGKRSVKAATAERPATTKQATKRAATTARKQAQKATKKAAKKVAAKARGRAKKAKTAKKSSRRGK